MRRNSDPSVFLNVFFSGNPIYPLLIITMRLIRHFHHPVLIFSLLILITGCRYLQNSRSPLEQAVDAPRTELLFDFNWSFHRGDIRGAENVRFDDSNWRVLDLPHDWSIENIPGTGSPNDPDAAGGVNTGYFAGGTAWYRKTFFVPSGLEGRCFHLQFDGVYMNADVWLNGEHLGNHPYGYTSFWHDITDRLEFGADNILSVRVRNEGRNSRWYSGSGIYRHVWLSIMNPVHVMHWGNAAVVANAADTFALVRITTELVNEGNRNGRVSLRHRILGPGGSELVRSDTAFVLLAGEPATIIRDIRVDKPWLWSPESPTLYRAITEILDPDAPADGQVLDRIESNLGIRTIAFHPQLGFLLNGEPTLLYGGCVHHDNGPLGSAAFDRAEERRVELLKKSGFNAIRCAHNPPSPAFLDACDRLGMLVIDEAFDAWRKRKNPEDYHLYFDRWWQSDLESMVLRDRNHPSVIMWSTGNEIPERGEPEGVETSEMLAEFIRNIDPTRPVTAGVNGVAPDKDPYFATLDVSGYNYAWTSYREDHERLPDRIVYGSESFSLEAFDYWMAVLENPHVIGDFVWTSFDYLGEASIGWLGYPRRMSYWPWTHAYCGDIDICGIKRPQSHYRDALWNVEPNVSVFVHPPSPSFDMSNPDKAPWSKWEWQDVVGDWTWPGHEGEEFEIEVYSSGEAVELFINDRSLGKKSSGKSNRFITRWKLPYEPGVLKAVAYVGNEEIASNALITAGEIAQIHLSADKTILNADGQDLVYINVELQDEKGNRHPKADSLLDFEIKGPGSIQAVASSNPMSIESYKKPFRNAYRGRALVIVRAGHEDGEIRLKASGGGLPPAEIVIHSNDNQ